ncbi:MAG TPA: Nramp family divalent metal transporter, partial [Candidatus Limnocylindrales bacterium]|nr:Nramp family divalent metal transporter [Candidatus Limnocylindrales bacterium]
MATASARTPASPSARPQTVAEVLARGRVRGSVRLLGPAFVAAVAYVDPGNFATNVAGGARYGYLLLWVIVAANATAMLVQYLSSKLGLVTGLSLPEACRARYPAPIRWLLWAQAELVAIATDVAEFLGAAIAIHLLTGASPLVGGLVTAVVAVALLGLRSRGFRAFEVAIAAFLLVVVLTFGALAVTVRVDAGAMAAGLVPRLADDRSVLLAIGILGATVMPHVVYLHSALVTGRVRPADAVELRSLLRFTRLDVMLAMCIAGAANAAMLLVAAATFHGAGAGPVETLDEAHAAVAALIGPAAALGFAIALLASGISSSSVGTMAG